MMMGKFENIFCEFALLFIMTWNIYSSLNQTKFMLKPIPNTQDEDLSRRYEKDR